MYAPNMLDEKIGRILDQIINQIKIYLNRAFGSPTRLILFLPVAFIIGFTTYFAYLYLILAPQITDANFTTNLPITSKILDRNGELLYEIGGLVQREVIGADKIPEILRQATLVAEDAVGLVKSKWNDIVAEVKPFNHSLSGFLQNMEPKEVADGSLVISTKYGFHKDRLRDLKNKKVIEDAIEKVTGTRLKLDCVVEK